jgi:hypothetical protein
LVTARQSTPQTRLTPAPTAHLGDFLIDGHEADKIIRPFTNQAVMA